MTVLRADLDLFFQLKYPEKTGNPNGHSTFYCFECLSTADMPNRLIGETISCPFCGDEGLFVPADQRLLASIAASRRAHGRCPNCNSTNYLIHQPSRPIVFGPMTFVGQLLAGLANSMADSIFTAELECLQCGHRWQHRE
jgi:hypothetical protein